MPSEERKPVTTPEISDARLRMFALEGVLKLASMGLVVGTDAKSAVLDYADALYKFLKGEKNAIALPFKK
jgi:hypothetical protein